MAAEKKTGGMIMDDPDDIMNEKLKELFIKQMKNGSCTINNDAWDALLGSSTDEELIHNWQSALVDLKNEVEHYWSELERMKSQKATEADFKKDMPELYRAMKFDQ